MASHLIIQIFEYPTCKTLSHFIRTTALIARITVIRRYRIVRVMYMNFPCNVISPIALSEQYVRRGYIVIYTNTTRMN